MRKHMFGKVFILCIGIIAVANVFSPKLSLSLSENRTLVMRPSFSFSSFLNGDFQKAYASYVNDQFYQRDAMREVKNAFEKTIFIRQIDDVFIGKDKQLMQAQLPMNQTNVKRTTDAMNAFANAYEDVHMMSMIVPNKATILQENIPINAPIQNQKEDITTIQNQLTAFQNIDVYQPFIEHKKEELYYKSDHHWTTFAAYIAFQSFLETKDIQEETTYESILVNDRFYGTLANATGLNVYDNIYLYKPINDDTQSVVNYVEEQKKTTSVYDMDKQYARNPYEVFLSGNHALVEITTTSAQDRSILVIKDSYANSFIPFLLPYYHHITVVDPRYYYEDISQLMRIQAIDEVLFLYNVNTFYDDTSLWDVLDSQ